MKKKINKKGEAFAQLAGLATGIAMVAIVLIVTFMIISQGNSQISATEGINYAGNCSASATCNATATLTSAVGTIPGWMPIVVICGISVVLLGIVSVFKRRY